MNQVILEPMKDGQYRILNGSNRPAIARDVDHACLIVGGLAKQGCDTLEAERTLMLAALEVEHD